MLVRHFEDADYSGETEYSVTDASGNVITDASGNITYTMAVNGAQLYEPDIMERAAESAAPTTEIGKNHVLWVTLDREVGGVTVYNTPDPFQIYDIPGIAAGMFTYASILFLLLFPQTESAQARRSRFWFSKSCCACCQRIGLTEPDLHDGIDDEKVRQGCALVSKCFSFSQSRADVSLRLDGE
jgi:hypothetical protein